MKLGEVLVEKGLITAGHLRIALERQVTYGGRLGTNIVEAGILTEDEFTKFLSQYFNVPFIDLSHLMSIDKKTISTISKDLAEKYKAIPFKQDKNKLHMAMLDPNNLKALDEFRFVTGYNIIPYAASELRILYVLEKYYGLKRDLRYISILDRSEEEKHIVVADSDGLRKIKEALTSVTRERDLAEVLISEAQKGAKRVALFGVKGISVTGWKAKGLTVEGVDFNELSPGGVDIFNEVLAKKAYYRGPVLKVAGNKEFIKILSGTPQDSLTIPISIGDRAVALLYADNGVDAVLDSNVNYLNTLGSMAAKAFEMLILRKEIMEM